MPPEPAVHVVEDDPAARESLCALVTSKGAACRGYASAEEFLREDVTKMAGCVVVDYMMAGMNGLTLQETLTARGCALPVILISGFVDVPLAVRAMRSGAVTVLQKPCEPQQVWREIHRAMNADEQSREDRVHRAALLERYQALSEDERQVLTLLIAGKQNKQIAAERDMGLRTVELRRATIMQKMQAASLAQLLQMAIEIGLTGD